MKNKSAARELATIGAVAALVGLVIIVWPERGLIPHPMAFPPSTSTRPLAAYAVLGFPLAVVGALFVLAGAVARMMERMSGRR